MLYINQRDYFHVPYYHNTDKGGPVEGRDNVGTSGCGLCCACMVVEHLTTQRLEVEEAVAIAVQSEANRGAGVSMKIFGPKVAEQFRLNYRRTKEKDEAIAHLRAGGRVIALVRHKADGTPGLFTAREHYILLVNTDGEQVCILDPYLYPGKFQEEGRGGKIREDLPFLYCSWDVLMEEVVETPCFYMFSRKTPE